MKTLLLCVTLSVLIPSMRTEPFFREYHHVKALKTWEEAQQACRELYSDLATVDSPAESTRLLGAIQEPGELVWIGLYDNMTKWKWTMGRPDFDSNTDYHCWQDDNPKYKVLNDTCGTMRYNGLWRDEICNTERPFVCYNEQGPSKFIFVSTLMTWDDAKNHCRSLYTDLARVNNETENTEIYALLPRNAWIGLYRRPWSPWSDHTPTNFANWDASQLGGLDPTPLSCGAVNTTTGLWFNVNCEEKHNFICQNLIPPRSRVKLRFRSGADLTDPQIQLQILEQVPDSQLSQEGRCRYYMCSAKSVQGFAMSQTRRVL
ncbi:macrophage mannose receptor 1-like isoform X1 [Oryzias melastigma]|uniref:macrophage mannose receptor 1-like isoform X1 n=1 Tax=Oryzias melastigma TaxID=30732 RepID=UPI00168D4EC0|nr:macrophage mannose receptor 1-like isoform X1 [Oryzias melastigma]